LSSFRVCSEFSACSGYYPRWDCSCLFSCFSKSSFFCCGLVSGHVYILLIVVSRFRDWSWVSIFLSCSSARGMDSFPVCASWMSCSSSWSVNSGLMILRFVSLCLASGVSMLLSSACFCSSSCCSTCVLLCSSAPCFRSAESFRLRSSSSSLSDTLVTFLVFCHFWYFLD